MDSRLKKIIGLGIVAGGGLLVVSMLGGNKTDNVSQGSGGGINYVPYSTGSSYQPLSLPADGSSTPSIVNISTGGLTFPSGGSLFGTESAPTNLFGNTEGSSSKKDVNLAIAGSGSTYGFSGNNTSYFKYNKDGTYSYPKSTGSFAPKKPVTVSNWGSSWVQEKVNTKIQSSINSDFTAKKATVTGLASTYSGGGGGGGAD